MIRKSVSRARSAVRNVFLLLLDAFAMSASENHSHVPPPAAHAPLVPPHTRPGAGASNPPLRLPQDRRIRKSCAPLPRSGTVIPHTHCARGQPPPPSPPSSSGAWPQWPAGPARACACSFQTTPWPGTGPQWPLFPGSGTGHVCARGARGRRRGGALSACVTGAEVQHTYSFQEGGL